MSIHARIHEYRAFLKEFVSKPILTGSIVPSSPALATELLANLDPESVKQVIEVGPGSGAITHKLLDSPTLHSRYFGLDINPVFVERLRLTYPNVRFQMGSAEDLAAFAQEAQLLPSDFVVSGLPWSLIRPHRQETILKNIFEVLSEKGEFVTFSYVHTPLLKYGRSFQRLLRERFPSVVASAVVWANLPPAIVYRCKKAPQTR